MGDSEKKVKLEKNIGLYNGVSLIISVIVGGGIFISPKVIYLHKKCSIRFDSLFLTYIFIKGVIKEVQSIGVSLIIWILCGVISIFGAQTYAELGCMIPKAGGDYEYILAAFGGLWGFLFVWAQLIIIIPTANAVAALTFADYMLQPFFSTCDPPSAARIMLAASAVCKRIFSFSSIIIFL